ncbi:MAG: HAMP domain-containing protein, partial [Verrucomicrobia bacterium]|nr:HAMP domain-containing protein [Verrucomicrobiota bacterium]
ANAPPEIVSPSRVNAGTRIHRRMNQLDREAFQLTEFGFCVLVGRPIASDLKALGRFGWWLVAAGGAVLAIGLGGGWRLATGALQPVEVISTTASRISAGNLAERIDVADTDSELGRLASVLNSTVARLETAFAQQRQFTADASHELRTPLTVMISEAQTTLARERTAAEYRETVQACLETAQRMRKLTQSLLELARFDAGQQQMESGAFDLAERVRVCVELVEPMARLRHLRLDCDLAPAEVVGDPDRLSQVVVNLLTNAVQYNHDHGRIRVTTRVDADAVVLTVTNTGPGISDEDLPHVFERFYRADKARGSAEGRHGLGLSICRAIVQAHSGTVSVASKPGADTTFTVRLPRFPPSRINWETPG